MRAAIFAYTRRGCETAVRIQAILQGEWELYTIPRLAKEGFSPLPSSAAAVYSTCFAEKDALLFISSCGIAVRAIAPYVKDKRTDPAVLCMDEQGDHVIPLLSGHIGGANALAKRLAQHLGGVAILTTATDVNGLFSVDTWATENGCTISSMAAAKAVSAAVLEEEVPLLSDFPVVTGLPAGIKAGTAGDVGIYIGYHMERPFPTTLRLCPKMLHLGIGCRRGTSKEMIAATVRAVLQDNRIDKNSLLCAASIDLKSDEAGLLAYCEEQELPIHFYSAEELSEVTGDFTSSDFVASVTGVDNVCERAALRGAEHLIVKKTARDGVTIALAAEHWEVRFG